MKNIELIIKISFFAFIIVFSSCEKALNNSKECSATSENDYEIINPEWKVIDENYTDIHGNKGILYQNGNNKKERMFKINEMQKANGGGSSSFSFTGIKETHWDYMLVNGLLLRIPVYKCVASNINCNCKITITCDEKGNLVDCLFQTIN